MAHLVYKATGKPVKEGDTVTDFRGGKASFCYGTEGHTSNSTGRVYVKQGKDGNAFAVYPSVFGLEWKED